MLEWKYAYVFEYDDIHANPISRLIMSMIKYAVKWECPVGGSKGASGETMGQCSKTTREGDATYPPKNLSHMSYISNNFSIHSWCGT
jgi:hypothetical protein